MNNPLVIVEAAMEIAYSNEVLEAIAKKYGAERARACAMSNSVGGIGPLLKERIPAQAEQGAEVIGVCLLYESVWTQGVYQWGQIYIAKKSVGKTAREFLEDTGIDLALEMPDKSSFAVHVWRTPLGKASVYYLDCPQIAGVVYPGPEDAPKDSPDSNAWVENQKLLQSWVIGRGALSLLKALNKRPDIVVQSETPAFFANHSLVLDGFQKDSFFENTKYIFNDHTPLEYAHPLWSESQADRARVDPAISKDKRFWDGNRKAVDVTRLLVGVSHGTFGVSKRHEGVMKAMPSLKDMSSNITSITNGVSVANWRDPDFKDYSKLSDPDLIRLKETKKAEMIEWVSKRYRLWANWRSKVRGKCFVNWTRRVTNYKRFDILEALLMKPELRKRFLETQIVILVGGRIHQNDNLSQNVMFKLLDLVARDKDLQDRVLVLDNYNVWDAPRIFHGVDATIMLADDGREASATGFMKAQVNGAMVIAVSDGAIPESVVFRRADRRAFPTPENGFYVPYVNGQILPENFLSAMEDLNKVYGDPKTRAAMIRASFAAESQVTIDRTAQEMIKLYVKLTNEK